MSSHLPTWPLQTAIYDRLASHAATSAYSVADNHRGAHPYVTLGPTSGVGDRAFDRDGFRETVQLDVWADDSKACKEIMADIHEALTDGPLDLSAQGFDVAGEPALRLQQVFPERHPGTDGDLRHGVLQYEFLIHERI